VLHDELETIAEGVTDDWGMGEGPRWRAPQTEKKEKRDSSLCFAAFGMTPEGKREKNRPEGRPLQKKEGGNAERGAE
jgi:hypothetical protein